MRDSTLYSPERGYNGARNIARAALSQETR